jgi:hypothetical protein
MGGGFEKHLPFDLRHLGEAGCTVLVFDLGVKQGK